METKEKNAAEKTKARPQKQHIHSDHGIQSFFQKTETKDDQRRTPEAAKGFDFPAEIDLSSVAVSKAVIAKPSAPRRPKKPALKVVEPPQFLPVRATTTDARFLDHLKIREFVLKCNFFRDRLTYS
jgi:hypothetical protein